MKIKIRNKHFRKATSYSSSFNCPLAMAIKGKKKFKHLEVSVGAATVSINGKNYNISNNWRNVEESKVDEKIQLAKNGYKLKKVSVKLKPW